MTDLRPTILAKSDQLNADDLIAGPMTIKITDVRLTEAADQPVAIHWEGGEGRPYKPCKSMRRVMIKVWGEHGEAFIGHRMTLFRDDKVRFGSDAVGGIRISHMSGLDRELDIALMVTRGKRAPYKVKPLPSEQTQRREQPQTQSPPASLPERVTAFRKRVDAANSITKLQSIWAASVDFRNDVDRADPDEIGETVESLTAYWQDKYDALDAAEHEERV